MSRLHRQRRRLRGDDATAGTVAGSEACRRSPAKNKLPRAPTGRRVAGTVPSTNFGVNGPPVRVNLDISLTTDPTSPPKYRTRTIDMSGDDDSSGWQLTESDPGVFTCVAPVSLRLSAVLIDL
jgi:hypothetical protein